MPRGEEEEGGGREEGTWPRLVKSSSILRTSKVARREGEGEGRRVGIGARSVFALDYVGRGEGGASVCFRGLSEYGRTIV